MERFNPRWVSAEEHRRVELRIAELETENEKLKNRNELIHELIGLFANFNGFRTNSTSNTNNTSGVRAEGINSLEQVIDLAKDLSNDIRNIIQTFGNRNND
ncbi:MAG TPA: hypothetical protein DDW65_24285 [Firmicutes bacterium]|nr:hypothetical protein [Bacillota bacterium]